MINIIDKLNFKNDPEIKATISGESLYYSSEIEKLKNTLFNSHQKRNIVITDAAIYNFKGKEKKRRIEIAKLRGITINKNNNEFAIHGIDNEYDYSYSSKDRLIIIQTIEEIHETKTGKELLFCIKKDKDLQKYIVSKKEREKNPKMYKIKEDELMSIKEFIESNGNVNINTHPASLALEREFSNINNRYKEENLSNFKVLSLLANGSTANVYLASYFGENVALKVFDKVKILKHNWIQKVLLEKNLLCLNNDKFLGELKFYFMTPTKIIFVMPFYQGGDLLSSLERHGSFDESTTAFYGVQIA